ncbi:unnamed protein product [Cyclocybe aegerita]|uniref:Protein kinase domain-containing protein n=1 Tax=Cyclocybe aegerita TaxID=1973307 RepID=A0A8S0W3Q6_CYCAE|nr:unnamed protein product [Cyclocybe aegerita]
MAPSIEMSSSSSDSSSSTSSSSSFTSTSEQGSFQYSSDSSMITPTRGNAATLSIGTASEARAELKIEFKGHIYKPISVADFAKHVWGLDPTVVDNILTMDLTLCEDAWKRYKDVTRGAKGMIREPKLHQPFRDISSSLLEVVCNKLGVDYATTVKDDFWDGGGSKYIKSRFSTTRRKPDMLRGWLPFKEDIIEWGETKSALEFKLPSANEGQKGGRAPDTPTPASKSRTCSGASFTLPSIPEGAAATSALLTTSRGATTAPAHTSKRLSDMTSTSLTKRSREAVNAPSRSSTRLSTKASASASRSSHADISESRSNIPPRASRPSNLPTSASLLGIDSPSLTKIPQQREAILRYLSQSQPASSTARSRSTAGSRSVSTNSTSTKRNISDIDGADEASEPKRVRRDVEVVTRQTRNARIQIVGDHLQLATYALECLGDSSRHYTTGIFVKKTTMSLWYYDRAAVVRTVDFEFHKGDGPKTLAVALYALSQANMKQAGFDPFLREFKAPKKNGVVKLSNILPLTRPQTKSTKKPLCFHFTTKIVGRDGEITTVDTIFVIIGTLYTYRTIIGRGTYVGMGFLTTIGCPLSNIPRIIKLSWQYNIRRQEAELLTTVRKQLPKYWHNHLPEVSFSAVYTAEELELPTSKMELEDADEENPIQGRRLHASVMGFYRKLEDASSVEEFRQIFLDCLECHYHTYNTARVLHRDISENNLMFAHPEDTPETDRKFVWPAGSPSVRGILNDFDLASELDAEGKVPASSANHRTGTLPFMAKDLLQNWPKSVPPPTHHYRHDLESFFYILIWAMTQYTLEKDEDGNSIRGPLPEDLEGWNVRESASVQKGDFYVSAIFNTLDESVLPHFRELWKKWVISLFLLFRAAMLSAPHPMQPSYKEYDFATYNGQITFQTFMAAMGETPRGLDPNGERVAATDVPLAAAGA